MALRGSHNVHARARTGNRESRIVAGLMAGKGEFNRARGPGGARHPSRWALSVAALVVGALALAPGAASAAMRSVKLADGTCRTTGGGRFVPIPGFPRERIDQRLLTDLAWLERRYPIFITDGYSLDPVHAQNGEHPLGLAVDIVPDTTAGGTWADVTALALFAEPVQNKPRFPFRWVGYKGDANHGPRKHLHLSWAHAESAKGPGHPVRTVYTLRCPKPVAPTTPVEPVPEPPAGGTVVKDPSGGGGSTTGGIGTRMKLAPIVPETE
jgi:hypothetical protein